MSGVGTSGADEVARRDKLVRRVRAMLAKAASSEHEGEAETFALRARQIMEEHQLSEHELSAEADPLGKDDWVRVADDGEAFRQLTIAASLMYGCQSVFQKRWWTSPRTGRVTLRLHRRTIGRQAARVTAAIMIPHLEAEALRTGRAAWRAQAARVLKVDADHLRSLRVPYASEHDAVQQVTAALATRILRLTMKSPARPGRSDLPVPVDEVAALLAADPSISNRPVRPVQVTHAAIGEAAGISLALRLDSPPRRSGPLLRQS